MSCLTSYRKEASWACELMLITRVLAAKLITAISCVIELYAVCMQQDEACANAKSKSAESAEVPFIVLPVQRP